MHYDFDKASVPPPAIVCVKSPMVGGFSPVPVTSAEALGALATSLKLLRTVPELTAPDLEAASLASVERQIVAGRNYRVTFQAGKAGDRHQYRVDFYQNLKGRQVVRQVYLDGKALKAS